MLVHFFLIFKNKNEIKIGAAFIHGCVAQAWRYDCVGAYSHGCLQHIQVGLCKMILAFLAHIEVCKQASAENSSFENDSNHKKNIKNLGIDWGLVIEKTGIKCWHKF